MKLMESETLDSTTRRAYERSHMQGRTRSYTRVARGAGTRFSSMPALYLGQAWAK